MTTDAETISAAAAAAISNPQSFINTAHDTLKYSLLGPSLTKPGQDNVDQTAVSQIIYDASKGSKFFAREEVRDGNLTVKIEQILAKKRKLERLDLGHDSRKADEYIAELELSRDLSQVVVHIDCDAFYAAVEQLDRPELKEVPFSVGKGVLTTCNYHARKFGCRSGMAGFVAKKLCPQLIQIPLNFEKYTAKAQEVRAVLAEYDARFESSSIDEAYLNITEYCTRMEIGPEEAVEQLRREVHEKTKITISAGIAANAKLAKICSNMNKPNGQFNLPRDRASIVAFMRNLPTRKVNGIGRVFERELDAIGVKTCGDIYGQRQFLSKLFGEKAFHFLMGCYLGIGRTNVKPAEEYERKSVGTESTFADMSAPGELRVKLRSTAEELEKDMRRTGFRGRTLVLKVKMHTYEVFTRQIIPPKAVYLADDLYRYSVPMLAKLEQDFPGMRLRLMGLRCTHLVSMKKADTFAFFGLKQRPTDEPASNKRKLPTDPPDGDDGEQWETWPEQAMQNEKEQDLDDNGDKDFEEAAQLEKAVELEMLEHLSQLEDNEATSDFEPNDTSYRRHGKEVMPNPKPQSHIAKNLRSAQEEKPEEEWWDCPICSRPQAAEERLFNAHIDLCLSRSTIREAVQEGGGEGGEELWTRPKRVRVGSGGFGSESDSGSGAWAAGGGGERKSNKVGVGGDPRQRRLCFG